MIDAAPTIAGMIARKIPILDMYEQDIREQVGKIGQMYKDAPDDDIIIKGLN